MKKIINTVRAWIAKEKPEYDPKIIRASFSESKKTNDVILKVVWNDGRHREYYGSGTVWHVYPMMWDVDRYETKELIRVYRYLMEFGNDYPTSNDKVDQ